MSQLKTLKRFYKALNSERMRASCLLAAEILGFRKDILRMDTNNLCNIECIMCSSKPQPRKEENIMPLEQYKKLIDYFAKKTRLLYLSCEYEPLMTPDFEKYLAYAKSKSIPAVSLCTNGLLLNDKLIRSLVDNKADEIIISLNGYNENDYNRIMARSNYNVFLKNLKKLTDYKREAGSQYPKIRINTILMKSNILEFGKLIEIIREHDVRTVQFRELKLSEVQNNINEVKSELLSNISEQELQSRFREICEKIQMLKGEGREFIVPAWMFQGKMVDHKQIINKNECSIPCFSYWIEYNGSIKSCLQDQSATIGNFFTDDIQAVINKRNHYRKTALKGRCDSSSCTHNMDSSVVV